MSTKGRVGVDITARDMTAAAFRGVQGRLAALERGVTAVKRVMQGFAVGTVGVALGQSLKSAVDRMDDMGKAAQRMGVGVENLSRLGYAARLSDVSIEQLGTSMNKLNRNMAAIAAGDGGEAGRAFRAIGVSVTDAAGQLKSGDQVMREVADRFSRMQDGAGKTAIAMAIFGKSGADMIPLLNGGSAAMRELGDEADRTGQTISESAARNAEVLNDNITRLQGRAEGFANLLAQKLIPDLIDWSDRLLGVADSASAAESAMGGFDAAKKGLGEYIETSFTEFKAISNLASGVSDAFDKLAIGSAADAAKTLGDAWRSSTEVMHGAATSVEMLRQQVERLGKGSLPSTMTGEGRKVTVGATPFIPSVPKLPKVDREHNAALAEAKRLYEGTRTAGEAYADTQKRLDELLAKGLISQDTYNRSMFEAKWALAESAVAGDAWQETLEKQSTVMKDVADIMQGEFMSAFNSIISGSQSTKKAFGDMARSILNSRASMAANWLLTGMIDSIIGGGGGVHALYGGALPSFAVGTSRVPHDMVAQIHKDEMIIPARQADAMRSGKGGGAVNISYTINAPGADASGLAQLRAQVAQMARDEPRRVKSIIAGEKRSNPGFA